MTRVPALRAGIARFAAETVAFLLGNQPTSGASGTQLRSSERQQPRGVSPGFLGEAGLVL